MGKLKPRKPPSAMTSKDIIVVAAAYRYVMAHKAFLRKESNEMLHRLENAEAALVAAVERKGKR